MYNTPSYFTVPVSTEDFNFSQNNTVATLAKKVLVMVEGEHTDSHGRTHNFSANRIRELVSNTNKFLASGGQIPWQKDHQKTQDFNIGHLESELVLRPVSERDIEEMAASSGRPISRFQHLLGKWGAFASKLVGKGQKVITDIVSGNIGTISPGIDPRTNTLVEISATPIPAINGLITYSQEATPVFYYTFEEPGSAATIKRDLAHFNNHAMPHHNNAHSSNALTWDDLETEEENDGLLKEQYEYLSENLFKILNNISKSSEAKLQGQDPVELSLQAIDRFSYELEDLFGLLPDPEEMQQQAASSDVGAYANVPGIGKPAGQGNLPSASKDPNYSKRQKGLTNNYNAYSSNSMFQVIQF